MNAHRNLLHRLFGPLLLLTLVLFTTSAHANGELTATVDRNQISIEETLRLQIRYNEQVMFGEPDFAALQQHFDILGRTRSHQYHNINGKTESWTQWTITLAPTREGQLLIPSFEYKGSFTDAIEISVTEAAPVATNDQPVYLETELDKTSGFVQEQFLYTVRLYTSVDLTGLDRAEPKIQNALVKPVAENQYQRVINGVPFGVVETTYAIFPQHSGTLEIPATVWSVGVHSNRGYRPDPFLSQRGDQLRLRTPAKTLQVDPKPDAFTGDKWLPARQIALEQRWSQSPDEFTVGEPITRTITIRAQGLMASQLPPLEVREAAGVKYYPDQPQIEESVAKDGVTAVKTESYAIVPSQAGKITLPAITLRWWDTQAKRTQEATLPAHTIRVRHVAEPADNQATTAADTGVSAEDEITGVDAPSRPEPAAAVDPHPSPWWMSATLGWMSATVVLLLTNLLTLMLWLRARQSSSTPLATPAAAPTTEKHSYKILQHAVKGGDAQAIRQALLNWGRVYENNPNLSSLQQLAQRLPPLAPAIRQLEAALYSQQSAVIDTGALLQVVQNLRRHGLTAATAVPETTLPPLYTSGTKT